MVYSSGISWFNMSMKLMVLPVPVGPGARMCLSFRMSSFFTYFMRIESKVGTMISAYCARGST